MQSINKKIFYLILFIVVCLILGLSIWAFITKHTEPFSKYKCPANLDPVPDCKDSINPDCGSHGDKKCPDGSLGYLEACDPTDPTTDKCCGYNVGFRKNEKLKCISDGFSCPSCR